MRHVKMVFLSVVTSVTLAACANAVNGPEDVFSPQARFPITVEPAMQTLAVPYGGPGAGMDPNMHGQFQKFVRNYSDGGVGAISVSAPRGFDAGAREFANRVSAQGVERSKILISVDETPARDMPEIIISYIRYAALPTACGDWSSNLGHTAANHTSPNFGCATQANLAAMVADPRDLVTPAGSGPSDAGRALMVLDKYRKGEPTGATKAEGQTGAVSSVGQQ
jgi:pilus assembly protein CpaD